jgi:hypothetical protein
MIMIIIIVFTLTFSNHNVCLKISFQALKPTGLVPPWSDVLVQVGPDTVPAYDPQHDDAGCFVTHQSESLCLIVVNSG